MEHTIDDMNKNNRELYYMIGVTEADLDDDKEPYGTPFFSSMDARGRQQKKRN